MNPKVILAAIFSLLFSNIAVAANTPADSVVVVDGCYYKCGAVLSEGFYHFGYLDRNEKIAVCVPSDNKDYVYPANINIPDYVVYKGVSYPVAAIADECFKESKTIKNLKLGKNVKIIGESSFNKSSIETIDFNSVLAVIDGFAFEDCKALTSVEIPTSVKEISFSAFAGSGIKYLRLSHDAFLSETAFCCDDLETLILDEGVPHFPYLTFSSDKLKEIVFPGTITLHFSSLMWMPALEKITFNKRVKPDDILAHGSLFGSDYKGSLKECICMDAVPPIIYESSFHKEICDNCVLTVPEGSIEAYRNATGWKNFVNIRESAGVDDIVSLDPEPLKTEYYDLLGRPLSTPGKGKFCITRTYMSDGSVRTTKTVNN